MLPVSQLTSLFTACLAFTAGALARAVEQDQYVLSDDPRASRILSVRHELKKAEIIPTVIDDFLPYLTVHVDWSKANASLGNTVNPGIVQKQPKITLHQYKSGSSSIDDAIVAEASKIAYTIVLSDPDAPSRDNPEWSQICHWIATEVKIKGGSIGDNGDTEGLKEIMPYKPPGPPPKTGKHRYVFIAFAPANGTTEELYLSKPGDRQHWGGDREREGVREWATSNGLIPVGANFIYSQNDKQ